MISNYIYKVTPDDKINDLIQDLKSGDPKLEPNTIIGTQIPNETTTSEHKLMNLTYEYLSCNPTTVDEVLISENPSRINKILKVYDQVFLYDYVFDKKNHGNKEIYRLLLAVSLKLDLLNSKNFEEFIEKIGKLDERLKNDYYYSVRSTKEAFSILTRTSGDERCIGDFSKDIAITSKFFYHSDYTDTHKTIELAKMICKSNSQYAECRLFMILYDRLRDRYRRGGWESPLDVLEEVALSEILGIPDSLTDGYYGVPGQVMMYLALRITRSQNLTDLGANNMTDLHNYISSIRSMVDDSRRLLPREVRDSIDLLE